MAYSITRPKGFKKFFDQNCSGGGSDAKLRLQLDVYVEVKRILLTVLHFVFLRVHFFLFSMLYVDT